MIASKLFILFSIKHQPNFGFVDFFKLESICQFWVKSGTTQFPSSPSQEADPKLPLKNTFTFNLYKLFNIMYRLLTKIEFLFLCTLPL